jgi:tRNA (cmo5U34)-methyltransferase
VQTARKGWFSRHKETILADLMGLALKDAFGPTAREYDRARRQLVPCFVDFYRAAVDLISYPSEQAITVLDLGAGTGLLAGFIANAFPAAQLTLLDIAPEMLARARERFANHTDRVRFMTADLDALQIEGSYDAIVSALAIHHLEDDGKRRLFKTIHAALKPGGVFVNAEQVSGPTAATERSYRQSWLRRVRALGVSEDDLAATLERMKLDRSTTVEAQLAWLSEAGFTDVDCAYKDGMFAVIGASKSPA